MLRSLSLALAVVCAPLAAAQSPTTIKPPQAPTKPVVPRDQSAAPKSAPAKPSEDDEIKLSADVAALLSRQPTVLTPAIRARAASELAGKPVPLNTILSADMRAVTPRDPVAGGLSLSMRAGYWAASPNGPSIIYLSSRQLTPTAAITLRFVPKSATRYLVVCHVSNPANWDAIIDGRITPLNAIDETTGAALIPATAQSAQRAARLVVSRSNAASTSQTEFLQRYELTPIRN
ncbi:MAG: hypothetical protein Q8R82_12590 [Hyphomonadaceae bacterium]|nr:hypothetical protein [Hyphomonadaceae bacterium]